jgi:hypothetical protein
MRPRGIEFHIAGARQQVRLVHRHGGEPAPPRMAAPSLAKIHAPRIAPMRLAKRRAQARLVPRNRIR